MLSNRERATKLVERSHARTEVEGTLVLCFERSGRHTVSYFFEFFPINDLIPLPGYHQHQQKLEDPIRTLRWGPPEEEDDALSSEGLPYLAMSFLHTRSSESGGVLYAVGGLTPDGYYSANEQRSNPFSLPTEFTRIPLSCSCSSGGGDMIISEVDSKLPMKSGKFYPLIVEICGLIYVLSGCPPPFKPSEYYWFEVYDPQEDAWEQLADPPLGNPRGGHAYSSPFINVLKYKHLVVGNKLYVSDGVFSCVYDTQSRKWDASNLFTHFYLGQGPTYKHEWKSYQRKGWGDGCGLGFPFEEKAILLNEKDKIFLCMMPPFSGWNPLSAFQIIRDDDDGEKAVGFPLSFPVAEDLPIGYPCDLVDLGQDFFALLLIEQHEDWTSFYRTLVNFHMKLKFDGTTPSELIVTSLRVCYRKPLDGNFVTPVYCFKI